MTQDPIEHPEGFETRERSAPLPEDTSRPDWLVGADDVLEGGPEAPVRPAPPPPPPRPATPAAGPLGVVRGGNPEAASRGWTGAASSVPKLTVVPKRDRAVEQEAPDEDLATPLTELDPDSSPAPEPRAPSAFKPLHEPWYLIWGEALLTHRALQAAVLAALGVLVLVWLHPWQPDHGASLGHILRHPDRYEGQSVTVSGEVVDAFDIGGGHVFHLRQGRDTVVVFSPTRYPSIHQRLRVVGTVSTGYLDGEPRVAIFEGGTP